MKKLLRFELVVVLITFIFSVFASCKEQPNGEKTSTGNASNNDVQKEPLPKKPLSQDFKQYWYAGDAEITSYKLEQARYGEIREGTTVLIYVTEPFLPEEQVKADRNNENNIPVLKLNKTKKYLTGIYPYSVMSSTFYPVHDNQHAVKSSFSMQEWCGHVYTQLNNRESFEIKSHSYFEGEADEKISLDKAHLEDEIWAKIRINPNNLPIGSVEIIPALEYFRLKHQPMQAFKANTSIKEIGGHSTYTIDYIGNERKLTIKFTTEFPYSILSWKEEFKSGFGPNAKIMISKGTKLNTLKTPYWRQNSNKFTGLRDSLHL